MRFAVEIVVGFALLGATSGCAKKEEPAPAEATPKTRRERCEGIVDQVVGSAELAGKLVVSALADDEPDRERARRDVDGAAKAQRAALLESCMGWSEEAVLCLSEPFYMLGNRERCESEIAIALGEAPPPPSDVTPGPPPAWHFTWKGEPAAFVQTSTGIVVAVFDDFQKEGDDDRWYRALVAVGDGNELWALDEHFAEWIVELPDGSLVVAVGDELRSLDPATGQARWRRRMPVDPDGFAVSIVLASPTSDAIVVLDDSGRLHRVSLDGRRIDSEGQLDDRYFDEGFELLLGDESLRYLRHYGSFRAFDAKWSLAFELLPHEGIPAVFLADGMLYALVDDELMELDTIACAEAETFSPSNWPHPGQLHDPSSDGCPGCPRAPDGCVKWAIHLEDVAPEPFAVGPDHRVFVNANHGTIAVQAGAIAWSMATGGGGRLAVGTLVFTVAPGADEGDPVHLWALDPADGTPRWRSDLPVRTSGPMYSTDQIHVSLRGSRLVAGYGPTIAMFELR